MEEDGGGDSQETTFSGTPNAAPAEAPAGAFAQPAVMMGPKSSLPKVMGILMMLYGIIVGLLSLLNLLTTGATIDMYEDMGVEFSTAFVYIESLTAVGVNFVLAYAGYQVSQYKKSGVKLGLYAIGVQLAVSLIGSVLYADLMAEVVGDSAAGGIIGGIGAFASVLCAAICGLFVALPVLASGDSMED